MTLNCHLSWTGYGPGSENCPGSHEGWNHHRGPRAMPPQLEGLQNWSISYDALRTAVRNPAAHLWTARGLCPATVDRDPPTW